MVLKAYNFMTKTQDIAWKNYEEALCKLFHGHLHMYSPPSPLPSTCTENTNSRSRHLARTFQSYRQPLWSTFSAVGGCTNDGLPLHIRQVDTVTGCTMPKQHPLTAKFIVTHSCQNSHWGRLATRLLSIQYQCDSSGRKKENKSCTAVCL